MTDNKETVEVEEKKEAEPTDQATAEETKVATEPVKEPAPQETAVAEAATPETKSESAANDETKPAEEATEVPAATSEESRASAEPSDEEAKEEPKEETNPLERSVEIKIPKAAIEAERRKIIQQYGKTARLDGFRKGKVPYTVLNDLYGVQAYNEAVQKLINAELPKALLPYTSTRVNQPDVVLVPETDPNATDVTFKATFEVMPDVKLPDFKTLKVTKFECTLTDEDVENTIKVMQQQRTVYTNVDRPAQEGDKVTIDFVGRLNGEEFKGGSHNDYSFTLGNGQMLPDFEKELIGMKAGEEKTFQMTFPSTYGSPELAGKEVEFDVKLKAVADPKVPPLDDEFAKAFQIDGGMEALRENVRENLQREVTNRIEGMTKTNVLTALLAVADFPVPKSIVEDRRQILVKNYLEQLKTSRGVEVPPETVPKDTYLQQAQNMIKLGYLISKIVNENGIQPTDDQVKALVTSISKSYEDPEEFIKWYMDDKERRNELIEVVTENNAVDWIVAHADTETKVFSFRELMAQQRV